MPWRSSATKSDLARDLSALAAERSPQTRLDLLHRVVALYGDGLTPSMPAERYLFEDVISSLMDRIAKSDRATAAGSLAVVKQLPETLVHKLSTDADIDVARPIIGGYEAMPESILLDVAKTGSQDHLRVIAGRRHVSAPVSDVVVDRGDRETVNVLAANKGAQLSPAGIDRLIDKSRDDAGLQALLVDRSNLSLIAIAKLLPIISDELASRLRGAALHVDTGTIERHLAEWTADRQKSIERTDACIAGLRNGDLNLNNVVRELVGMRRLLDAAVVLGATLGLDRAQSFGMLTGGKLDSAMLLMRAADLSWPAAEAVIKLRLAKAEQGDYQTPPARADYLAIEVCTAQRVIRFMKVTKAVA